MSIRLIAVLVCGAAIIGCTTSSSNSGGPQRTPVPNAPGACTHHTFMFPTWDASIKPELEAAVCPQDYISSAIAISDPGLLARVGVSHVFGQPSSVAAATTLAQTCPASVGQISYALAAGSSPAGEQSDPAGATLNAMAAIHANPPCAGSGFANYVANSAVDGPWNGFVSSGTTCTYDPNNAGNFYNETTPTAWSDATDFPKLDSYELKAGSLLSTNPSNACYGSLATFIAAITDRTNKARAANPTIIMTYQVSLRDEGPVTIANAVPGIEAIMHPGDRIYLAYSIPSPSPTMCPDDQTPPTPPPNSIASCTFASPANYAKEMSLLGRPTPGP